MYGAIEAGGTKFVCSIGDNYLKIVDQTTIPTLSPKETIPLVIDFFKKYKADLKAIGIGSFGPINVNKASKTYGYITHTPKIKWRNFNFLGTIQEKFPNVEIDWTTDVNAAAYGEYRVREGVQNLVYYTIGTGIGGGGVKNGKFIEGMTHPEMGHASIRKHPDDDFSGICPSHGDCLEGLAAGPAIEARLNQRAENTPASDPYWDIQAYYIAQSAFNTSLYLSPEVIIYGGGVMKVEGLLDKVYAQFDKLNQDYVDIPAIEDYITKPELKDSAATIGCFAIAKKLIERGLYKRNK